MNIFKTGSDQVPSFSEIIILQYIWTLVQLQPFLWLWPTRLSFLTFTQAYPISGCIRTSAICISCKNHSCLIFYHVISFHLWSMYPYQSVPFEQRTTRSFYIVHCHLNCFCYRPSRYLGHRRFEGLTILYMSHHNSIRPVYIANISVRGKNRHVKIFTLNHLIYNKFIRIFFLYFYTTCVLKKVQGVWKSYVYQCLPSH